MRIFYVGAALVALAAMMSGCATVTSPKVVGTTEQAGFMRLANEGAPIFLLPPLITFEDAKNEQPLTPLPKYGSDHADVAMATVVPAGLGEAGMRVLTVDSLASSDLGAVGDAVRRLTEESRVLVSVRKDKSALLPALKQVADISGAGVACVQTVRVKVGSGAMYDPNSGAMAQGTNSTAIAIAFVSLTTGEVVWKNEAFVRYLPSSGKFEKAVKMLFAR